MLHNEVICECGTMLFIWANKLPPKGLDPSDDQCEANVYTVLKNKHNIK
jgi:hypothetical protein